MLGNLERVSVDDALFILILILFLVMTLGLLVLCGRLMED